MHQWQRKVLEDALRLRVRVMDVVVQMIECLGAIVRVTLVVERVDDLLWQRPLPAVAAVVSVIPEPWRWSDPVHACAERTGESAE